MKNISTVLCHQRMKAVYAFVLSMLVIFASGIAAQAQANPPQPGLHVTVTQGVNFNVIEKVTGNVAVTNVPADAPNAAVPIIVSLMRAGETTPLMTKSIKTGEQFSFNIETLFAGTYSITAAPAPGQSPMQSNTVNVELAPIGVEKIILNGVTPEDTGPATTVPGASVTVIAKPQPLTVTFPNGKPVWTIDSKPFGSNVTAPTPGEIAKITPDVVGRYVLKATAGVGTASKTFIINAIKVTFSEGATQTYGFDDYDRLNPTVPLLQPWKSVEINKVDTAKATIEPADAATGTYFVSTNIYQAKVSPEIANVSPQTLSITAGVGNGNADIQAKAGSNAGSNAGSLHVTVRKKKPMSISVRVINEQNDDLQVIGVGKGKPNVVCIVGIGGVLHTAKGGDDQIVGATITTGNDGLCQTTAAGGDEQKIPVGNGSPDEICVSSGTNAFRDTPDPNPYISDDKVVGDNITTGLNGICRTTAKSTDTPSKDVSDGEIKEYLNKVYRQAVVEWTVNRLPSISVNYDLNRDGYIEMGGTFLSSAESQAVRDAAQDNSTDANIFFVGPFAIEGNPGTYIGRMGSGNKFGFVDAGGGYVPHSIAHELGHGMWRLTHPDQQAIPDNDLENLMLSDATLWRLRKGQWDIINPVVEPPIVAAP